MTKESKFRRTEMSLSFLMQKLYGQKSYRELKDYNNVAKAKKYYLKLIKSFSHAISETIEISDKTQIKNLNNILINGEKQINLCEKFSELDQIFITIETKLVFQLLGMIPNHSREETVLNRKENWKLNSIRQIQYVQSSKQKEMMIFKLIQDVFINRFGDLVNFVSIYKEECNNDLDKLINYLKQNHPDIYEEIQ